MNAPARPEPGGRGRDLTAAALHRMSQPLTVLRGTVELALTRPLEPQQFRETLLTMARETERLVALAEALRALNDWRAPQGSAAGPAYALPAETGAGGDPWTLSRLRAELAPLAESKHVVLAMTAAPPRAGTPGAELAASWCPSVLALANLALDRARDRLELRLLGNGLAITDNGVSLDSVGWDRAFDPFAGGADITAALRAALARRQLEACGATIGFGPAPGGGNQLTVCTS